MKEVLDLLVEGKPRLDIIAIMSDRHGVKKSQVDNYIKRANKGLESAVEAHALDSLNYIQIRFNKIYEEAMAKGDYAEANKALAHLAKFSGLEPAKKIESKSETLIQGDLQKKSTEDLIKSLELVKD